MQENPLLNQHDEYKIKTRDMRAVKSLRVLVGLALLYTLYFAQSLIVPLLFSALVALLLSPLVTKFQQIMVPRSISSVFLLTILVAPFSILGIELAEPAERWMKLLPTLSVEVTQQLDELSGVFSEDKQVSLEVVTAKATAVTRQIVVDAKAQNNLDNNQSAVEQKIKQGGLEIILSTLTAAPIFIAQILGSVVLILFLLIFGPSLFEVFVEHFPIVKNKQRANHLVSSIRHALSRYIATVSVINTGLGVFTAIGLSIFGVEDAILWGAIVGLVNFVPYIGSIFSLSILLIVGLVQFGMTATAILPGAIFILLNIIESQIVTPAILGNSMRVNPLVIILCLFLCGWLWGVLGVLLAVPLLVCIKLALEQMEISQHWLKLIEAS